MHETLSLQCNNSLQTTQMACAGVTHECLHSDERDLGHPDFMSAMMLSKLLRQRLEVRGGNASHVGRLLGLLTAGKGHDDRQGQRRAKDAQVPP